LFSWINCDYAVNLIILVYQGLIGLDFTFSNFQIFKHSRVLYQKDYILRMIEMLGELLRAIFGMISKGRFDQAQQSISEAYLTLLRQDSAFFQGLPAEKLTTALIEDHNFTHAHLEILAELMFAEAELNDALDRKPESLIFYNKSLLLFEFVDKAYKTYSAERLERMQKIRLKINRPLI